MANFFNTVTITSSEFLKKPKATDSNHMLIGQQQQQQQRQVQYRLNPGRSDVHGDRAIQSMYTDIGHSHMDGPLKGPVHVMRQRPSSRTTSPSSLIADYVHPKQQQAQQQPQQQNDTSYRKRVANTASESDNSVSSQHSGFESPLSDSGCSLASHLTNSEGKDAERFGKMKFSTRPQRQNKSESPDLWARKRHDNNNYDCSNNSEPLTTQMNSRTLMLRRTQSNVNDHAFLQPPHPQGDGFRHSNIYDGNSLAYTPEIADDMYIAESRQSEETPTPSDGSSTNSQPTETQTDMKLGDRFNRFRASLRQSFAWGGSKPDFRTEAFAARQGEARALLALRDARMEVSSDWLIDSDKNAMTNRINTCLLVREFCAKNKPNRL